MSASRGPDKSALGIKALAIVGDTRLDPVWPCGELDRHMLSFAVLANVAERLTDQPQNRDLLGVGKATEVALELRRRLDTAARGELCGELRECNGQWLRVKERRLSERRDSP